MDQLAAAAKAVYRSWAGSRAREYRRLNGLQGLAGTAVTVQTMVFGNAGGRSGAGVAFSRNPATGEKGLYVDFLSDAQGEDVVSGRRMPSDAALFALRLPEGASELADGAQRLEREFRDVQDIEFTVEHGTLFFLQTRSAKRTPRAALRFGVDFVRDGLLSPVEAAQRLEGLDAAALAITHFVDAGVAAARGTGAAAGVAVGRAAFDSGAAQALAARGDPVILVRPDANTADVAGFSAAAGILAAAGGRTAHAALVARHMDKPCIVGCRALSVNSNEHRARLGDSRLAGGDWIAVDGGSGEVFLGQRKIITEFPAAELEQLKAWRAGGQASQAA